MNFSQARVRLVQAGAAMAAAVLVAGCGSNLQSTVTTSGSTGPAAQPTSLVAVVSAPSTTAAGIATPGIATIFDYSGDTWMAQASIGPDPYTFALDSAGNTGYTINSNKTISAFPVSKSVKDSDVESTTLPGTANPLNLYMTVSALWAADLDGNVADAFIGNPETYLRPVPLAPTPVFVAGPGSNAQRIFGISQGNSQGEDISSPVQCNVSPTTAPFGEADVIESSSYTVDSVKISLGKCPVYAVESSDGQRLFVLNRGSDTVSVINTQTGLLNNCKQFVDSNTGRTVTCHSTLPLSQAALNATDAPANCNLTSDPTCSLPADGGLTAAAGPVYAEYNTATGQLVIANYDGGTISIIDVSLDMYGNDSAAFGTTYTVPVGKNPASVTVLYDGSRAYTANQSDQTVSIVNLSSHTVVGTLPVTGYPRTVASTQNSSYGKVYVASPNSNVLTIIRTDEDTVNTAPTVQGHIVDVRVSTQNAVKGNSNTVSRRPGYGQPCNLPPSQLATDSTLTLKLCQQQP
jgi:YVTN family beta-propeller protein